MWEGLARGYNKEPYYIRRLLTEGAAKASDKRAVFVGAEAYEAAGGVIARDLFQHDGGGWFEDVALLDRLAREKLEAVAAEVRSEGWKWLEVALDFPVRPHHGPAPGRSGGRGPERGGSGRPTTPCGGSTMSLRRSTRAPMSCPTPLTRAWVRSSRRWRGSRTGPFGSTRR